MKRNCKQTYARKAILPALLLALSLGGQTAHALPVSGAIADIDYLRAQKGGYGGVKYPRYIDQHGNDVGQMVYPVNGDTAGFAFVMDIESQTVASITNYTTSAGKTVPGVYTYSFANLAPGQHHLMYVEPYREEVYTLASKVVTVTVPATGTAPFGNISLRRQWQVSTVTSTNAPSGTASQPMTGVSTDYLTASEGWAAVSTNNGQNNGWGPGRYAVDIYQTLDGGHSWRQVSHVPAPVINNYGPADVGSMVPPQYGLHFTDALHGVLLAQVDWNFFFWGNGLVVLTTSDGGKTWSLNGNGATLNMQQWAATAGYQTNTATVSANILWVNDYYNSYTNEVAWDPNNRANGVMYGVDGSAQYTRVTNDGGNTWTAGLAVTGGPDVGASVGDNQRLFVFGGNHTAALSDYNGGSLFYDGAPNWSALTDATAQPLTLPSAGAITGHTTSSSAAVLLNDAAGEHNFRSDDNGHTWRRQYFYNGRDSYTGSLQHSYSYLSDRIDLLPGDDAWLSSYSQDGGGLGRSLDGLLSRSWMGAMSILWNYSSSHTPQRDVSIDLHTGRRVLLMDPAYYGTTYPCWAVLSYTFDEKSSGYPPYVVPIVSYVGYHYNAGPGLYCCFANAGGDWAQDVTITGVTATNGVTFSAPALPWNIGAIPPASTTNQDYSWTDPGEIFFPVATIPSGVTTCLVTITGTYNTGKTFSVKHNVTL